MSRRKPKPPKPRRKTISRSIKRLQRIDQLIAEQAKIDAYMEAFSAALARCDAETMKNLKRSYWEI